MLLSTFFYLGYSPIAPGTVGTLGAILLYMLISRLDDALFYLIFTIIFIFLSFIVSKHAIEKFGKEDPGEIVIDEVCGYMVSMFLIPFSIINIALGFFIFRLFDIVKPYPARKLEKLPGGYGVVMDDVAAGIYTNLLLQLINYFKLF
ncbi:MAG: phosphatidylglycerophosphatase A [Candidatus Dadabacteria bacterium]|nr:phosphatidylglycerophosphatase A [Candidatus Dadabacteria bacterium]NIQ14231.1 phosphatidylglycerophosphatase A [Candidatus Dadabacteria bacterium]